MPIKILSDHNPDGCLLGGDAQDKVGFWGAVPTPQRSNPLQTTIHPYNMGAVWNFVSINNNWATVAANTGANQANLVVENFNAAGAVGVNAATTDFILGIGKPTKPANGAANYAGITGFRASAANTVDVHFTNPGGTACVITVNEVGWTVASGRGFAPYVANLVANTNAAANGATTEVIYSLGGTNATATATVANGGVTGIAISNAGAGYYMPPTVVITAPANTTYSGVTANTPTLLTGTALPFPVPSNGVGATAIAVVANGGVTSVVVTDPGSGYTTAPTVSFVPSTFIAPGMFPVFQQNTYTANLGIGNVRIPGKNQIAVQYVNPSAANIIIPSINCAVLGLTSIPAISPMCAVQANFANMANSGINGAWSNTAIANVWGVVATDVVVGQTPATFTAAANCVQIAMSNCAANALNIGGFTTGPGAGANLASGIYNLLLNRFAQPSPIQVFQALISNCSALASNTTNEQTFTLPGSMVLNSTTNWNVLNCSKPTHTSGLSVVGCRQASNTTVAITWMNSNSSAITPPNEVYTFAFFPALSATVNTAATPTMSAFATGQPCSTSMYQTFALANELQQMMVMSGQIKGG